MDDVEGAKPALAPVLDRTRPEILLHSAHWPNWQMAGNTQVTHADPPTPQCGDITGSTQMLPSQQPAQLVALQAVFRHCPNSQLWSFTQDEQTPPSAPQALT
ncbi:MAG: hypothetical protein WBV82_05800 [Myxococcaceae bacterium]